VAAVSYHVKTAVFEGPLDLLLQLVTRHQVDVASLSLGDLVTEYLSYLEEMRLLDLEITSEFLLIAATLVQLKIRRLLPVDTEVDFDEELSLMEERDRLLSRLLACVTFKDVAAVLSLRMEEANRHVPRVSGIDQQIRRLPPDIVLSVDADGLAALAARALARWRSEPDLDHLDLELPSVQAALDELRARVVDSAETTFDDLVAHCQRPVEVAAYFLALLELARWGMVELAQRDWLAKIEVTHRPIDPTVPLLSEWAP
jgi:segregation and condensation protein A